MSVERRRFVRWAACIVVGLALGCENSAAVSRGHARAHAEELRKIAASDVEEVRRGLPAGAEWIGKHWPAPSVPADDASAARTALEQGREKIQDLRTAKSTFFALALPNGVIVRNDQAQDLMAGRSLFEPFPELRKAVTAGGYAETTGQMPEARGVEGRPDGQWIAAAPVRREGEVAGLYVTGWSWSSYAYRLEFALRSSVRSRLAQSEKLEKEPLLYTFIVVGDAVYGAPITPEVNLAAVATLGPNQNLASGAPFEAELEITGRKFGVAAFPVPELGAAVAVGVLRSET